VINPLDVTYYWLIPFALVPALLGTILIFLDQQITSVIVNRKEHKLKVYLILSHLSSILPHPMYIIGMRAASFKQPLLRTCSAAEYQLQNILSMPIYASHGAPYWGRFCNRCGLYANMPSHMRSHILRKSAYRIFFRIYKLRFQNCIYGNYAAYAKIRISSHISAYAIAYVPHILHICRIFQRIISPNSVYFPAYFASKRPAYFMKNFRFMVMCLVFFLLQQPRVTTRFHTPI